MMLLSFEVQKYAKIMTWAKIRATFYGEGMGEMGEMGGMGGMGDMGAGRRCTTAAYRTEPYLAASLAAFLAATLLLSLAASLAANLAAFPCCLR